METVKYEKGYTPLIPHEKAAVRTLSTMPEDQANTKESSKELVLAAIQTLREKGAEINPYTVANEAKLPRSTIYRNAELMDLVSRERTEPAEKLQPKLAGYADRVAELEAEVEQLGQTIWNLETQNEELQKDFQDAWTMGFAAGLEEANKRNARAQMGASAEAASAPAAQPKIEESKEKTAESETPSAEPVLMPDIQSPSEPPPPVVTPVISPVTASAGEDKPKIGIETGENISFAADTSPLPAYHTQPSALTNSQRMSAIIDFTTAAETAAAEAAESASGSGGGQSPVISDRVIFSDPPSDEFSYIGEDLGQEFLYSPELMEAAETRLYRATDKADGTAAKSAAADRAPAPQPARPAPAYTLDFSQADTGNYRDPLSAAESGSNRGALEGAQGAVALDTAHQPTPAADVFAAQHTYDPLDGIYNVARSGPYVASEFNPLIELAWKDIEDVYNYRASTLKDYARNVPSAPTKLITPLVSEHEPGTNGDQALSDVMDASILALLPSDEELKNLQQHRETAVYMSDEVADVMPEIGNYTQKEDPNATGDRMQAMVGYRPEPALHQPEGPEPREEPAPAPPPAERQPFDSEGIVDLDAIDIFDNLDEWIDIDRLERGEDPFSNQPAAPATAASESSQVGGDELRELLKNRIKQSAELAPDPGAGKAPFGGGAGLGGGIGAKPAAPAAAASPAAGAAAGAAAGGESEGIPRPKNKFIGGKGTDAPVPSPSTPFVRQIPAEIRKACMILGVRPDEMTKQTVVETWKSQITKVHPDLGGDTEAAIFLNTAKDTIIHWLDDQAPKLGKKFMPKDPPKDKDKS